MVAEFSIENNIFPFAITDNLIYCQELFFFLIVICNNFQLNEDFVNFLFSNIFF